ncbi:serine hydrolase [Pseudanabaenaceae cyanobacterium LEGE 13415]|nr:serine hydrolase [Pseudanabaenaceae cyanobacterium LEGE 13415]
MWDDSDDSVAANNGRTAQRRRSRRRAVETPPKPIPLPSRRERVRKPIPTERPKSREFATTVRSFRNDRPRSKDRRRLEVVPPPEVRRTPTVRKPPAPKSRSALAFLYGTRLLILGVGIGVIAGTSLSIWDPATRLGGTPQPEKTEQASPSPSPAVASQLQLNQEITGLKTQIQNAIASQTQLAPGFMIVDADTHAFVDINGSNPIPAASTIKFPILVAFFQAVDEGKIRLDEPLTMRKELVAAESGELQTLPVGSQFPAIEVATKMIDISDNTATNMIIDRLGGKDAVNQRFQSWGLTNTTVQNPLPDLPGTNISSPRDMVALLDAVNRGELVSMRSHDRMLTIMRKVVNNSLLPQGLGEGSSIAHKTGDIGTMLGDVGIIDLPNGKRYLMAAMVKRPHNDDRAGDMIRQVSKLTFQYFNQLNAAPPSPAPSPQGAETPKSTIAQP